MTAGGGSLPPAPGAVASGVSGLTIRPLVSDYLIVRLASSGELFEFRDTFSANDRSVRNRDERLSRLFIDPPPDAVQQASEIANESARFLLRAGRQAMIVTTPLASLAILQPRYATRFRFTLGTVDRGVGSGARIVRFEEEGRPTVFRDDSGGDVVARGRFWIDEATGRVLKSELSVGIALITTTFGFNQDLQMEVPTEMQTQHRFGSVQATVRGTATYGGFRRFRVTTNEVAQ